MSHHRTALLSNYGCEAEVSIGGDLEGVLLLAGGHGDVSYCFGMTSHVLDNGSALRESILEVRER